MKVLLLSGLGPTFKNRSYYEGTILVRRNDDVSFRP